MSWVNEVKELLWKVIAKVVSDRDLFVLSYQQDLGSMLKLKSNPHISQSRPFIMNHDSPFGALYYL